MKKSLYDLTKDDWNTLFPVELVDYNPEWKTIFEKEKERILTKIGSSILQIEHFGSTSIPNIKAKPYIDMIIEVSGDLLFDKNLIASFEELGYTYFEVPEREKYKAYMSFGKGYTFDGAKEQIFHIHMCDQENAMWQQIAFRDELIVNTGRAKAYEALKIDLASKYKNDRGNYVLSKTDFINETLGLIK
ncbi:MAG: GrpB family protein [Flavobacteriaceae bacterium]|nr:GrpB family protein [Flavobacteriaceae bacterium]